MMELRAFQMHNNWNSHIAECSLDLCHVGSSDHLPNPFTITVFLELAMSDEYLFLLAIYLLGFLSSDRLLLKASVKSRILSFQSPTLRLVFARGKKLAPDYFQWLYFTRCKGSVHMVLSRFNTQKSGGFFYHHFFVIVKVSKLIVPPAYSIS